MSEKHNYSVVGLPGSGKTTFLAALWDGLSRPTTQSRLSLTSLPVQRKYLTEIHERWLRCEPTPYTRLGQGISSLTLSLSHNDGSTFDLMIPDIAGEAYNELWERRTWTDGLQELSRDAEGLLVFVHADDIVTMHPLVVDKDSTESNAEGSGDAEAPNAWDPSTAPTQVKVIDLIQGVRGLNRSGSLPIALVLSAWDAVEEEGVSPDEFVCMRMPMLWQYLQTNDDLPSRIFGLSAQGGSVESKEEADRLRKINPPSGRVKIVEAGRVSSEIARPLVWLLERDSR